MKLYRVMKVDPADGKPLVGVRRNMLGVRPTDPACKDRKRRFDVPAVAGADVVEPGTASGLSVSASADRLLPAPDEAVFVIESAALPATVHEAPDGPPHHVLEPARAMTLDE